MKVFVQLDNLVVTGILQSSHDEAPSKLPKGRSFVEIGEDDPQPESGSRYSPETGVFSPSES